MIYMDASPTYNNMALTQRQTSPWGGCAPFIERKTQPKSVTTDPSQLSKPFHIQRGIRQGNHLLCPIFNLAIELLACLIRKDENLKGLTIPGIPEPVKANFFTDDTSLYLGKTDSFAQTQQLLDSWCHVSGAKFNIKKIKIIPIEKEEYRQFVAETRRVNLHDDSRLNERIHIACDGEATRFLGAWIENYMNNITPWEPILVKIKKRLDF